MAMQLEHFSYLPAYGEHWIERSHGFLEDHGDLIATDVAHLCIREIQEIFSVKTNRARNNLSWG